VTAACPDGRRRSKPGRRQYSATGRVRGASAGWGTPVALGGLCGLTWTAALRGWVVQLAGSEPSFSWLTFLLLLLPGVAVGMLLGWAAYLRVNGMRQPRWLVFAPVLFASALLDPEIFAAFIRNGEGGGSLMVVATALAGGFVLSRTGFSAAPVASALVLLPGLLVLGFMGTMAAPVNSPGGALVCLYGLALILLLCFASALPYPVVRGAPGPWSFALLGGLRGLAWSGGLRSFMSEVAGGGSDVHWVNTFGFVLLPECWPARCWGGENTCAAPVATRTGGCCACRRCCSSPSCSATRSTCPRSSTTASAAARSAYPPSASSAGTPRADVARPAAEPPPGWCLSPDWPCGR
jgi:hypothetical protein